MIDADPPKLSIDEDISLKLTTEVAKELLENSDPLWSVLKDRYNHYTRTYNSVTRNDLHMNWRSEPDWIPVNKRSLPIEETYLSVKGHDQRERKGEKTYRSQGEYLSSSRHTEKINFHSYLQHLSGNPKESIKKRLNRVESSNKRRE